MSLRRLTQILTLAVAACAVFAGPAASADAESLASARVAELSAGGSRVDFRPLVDGDRFVLTVSAPGGTVFRKEFAGGKTPTFSLTDGGGAARPDGVYNWELTVAPSVDRGLRRQIEAARRDNDAEAERALMAAAGLPKAGLVQSGTFRVEGGQVVSSDTPEPRARVAEKLVNISAEDQVIPDDLIVQQSLCVGFDCVNNETFGFDTIKLKENNLRIKFEDTSVGTFPTNDWQLTANDSASGGSSKFSIEDITGAKVPFTIQAGATTNSIFVDSTGRVGLRTSTPVLDLHINTSNTPAMRLEQNNSGGFTAQTWDIAGNEANFFVRDVTGGSRLPLRIRPGAPTSSVDISADGDVGIGTASPSNSLHVTRSDGTTKVLISETSGTTTPREVLELRNNGGAILILKDTALAPRWSFGTSGTSFVIDNQANAGVEMSLDQNGNVVFLGTVTPPSSRTMKRDLEAVSPTEILQKVVALPVARWSYIREPDVRHMGPMAEDFHAAFALGANDKGISTTDSEGVALAAIQGLHLELQQRDAEIADLKARLGELAARLEQLEKSP